MLSLALLNYRRDKDGALSEPDQAAWDAGWKIIHALTLARHLRVPDVHSERCVPLLRDAVRKRLGPHLADSEVDAYALSVSERRVG